MKKSCIVSTLVADAEIIKAHLPPGITVAAEQIQFGEFDVVELRLEGDGLPEWCKAVPGEAFMRATIDILDDGGTRLIPGVGMPAKQIPDKFRTKGQ